MNQPENMTLKATVESPNSDSGSDSGDKPRSSTSLSDRFSWPCRIALLTVVVLSPWAFASVQNWAQFWITVALLIGLAFWWFETALNNKKTQIFPYIALLVFLGLGIGLVQTLSIPDGLANSLLGRQVEIYRDYTNGADTKVSISLDRDGTWHQIRLLVIALSGLLLGARYFQSKRDLTLLLSVVSLNGFAIAFFGIIHKLTDNGKMFWVHEYPAGMPFGPFVNRNNAAGYLLMCLGCCLGLLTIVLSRNEGEKSERTINKDSPAWQQLYMSAMKFIAELTATRLAVLIGAIVIAAAIPSTLSRGGVVGLLIASIGTILVYGMARKPKNFVVVVVPLMVLSLAFAGWIGFGDELMSRFDRIDTVNINDADERVEQWRDTSNAIGKMGVLGAGLGSYKNVHRLYRTGPERSLFVYAENQYFQSLIEAGWIGLALFLLAWLLAYQYASLALYRGSSSTTIAVGTMGVFVIFSQAVVSCFDFGLYIASNMLLFAVLIGFLAYHGQALAGRLKRQSWLRFKMPNYLVQFGVLFLFAAATMVALDLYRRAAMDRLMRPRASDFTRFNLDLAQTDERIASLTSWIQTTPTVEALNYVGELWIHRSRLAQYKTAMELPDLESSLSILEESNRERFLQNLWILTELQRVQENAFYLRREESKYEAKNYLEDPAIRENLPMAKGYFEYSRESSPLQPLVHLRLAEIEGVIGGPRDGDLDIERALELAPSNPDFRKVAGVYYLQSGDVEAAIPHFKKYLELLPIRFVSIMNLITGRTSRNIVRVNDEVIARIIPDDSSMLYDYVAKYIDPESPMRTDFLQRAAKLIDESPHSIREHDVLRGHIYLALGELENAVDAYRKALIRQPNDPKTRYKRAEILRGLGRLDEALEEAEYLETHTERNRTYNRFLSEVKSEIRKRDQTEN